MLLRRQAAWVVPRAPARPRGPARWGTGRRPGGPPPRKEGFGARQARLCLLQRAAGDASDERVQEEVVDDRDWDRDDQRSRHERAPEEHIAANEIGHDAEG